MIAAQAFPAAWPEKAMSQQDRRLFDAVANAPGGPDMAEIERLLADRKPRNRP